MRSARSWELVLGIPDCDPASCPPGKKDQRCSTRAWRESQSRCGGRPLRRPNRPNRHATCCRRFDGATRLPDETQNAAKSKRRRDHVVLNVETALTNCTRWHTPTNVPSRLSTAPAQKSAAYMRYRDLHALPPVLLLPAARRLPRLEAVVAVRKPVDAGLHIKEAVTSRIRVIQRRPPQSSEGLRCPRRSSSAVRSR
jgi:hypothetical protein